MKKLFFSALVAVVAVGGALSVNAETYYLAESESPIICEGQGTSCADFIDGRDVYLDPNTAPTGTDPVNPDDYAELEKTN